MILEVVSSSVVGGVFLAAKLKQKGGEENDHEKIKMIAENIGLQKGGKGLRLHRKSRPKGKHYTEYVYQIPLGFDFGKDIKPKIGAFEDGLNNKKTSYIFRLSDLKKVNWHDLKKIDSLRGLPEQFKRIFGEKQLIRKTVDMSFDGMLRIKVYDRDIPKYIDFDSSLWGRCKDWEMPLGETREGIIFHELDNGHIVVAGATTFGKSQLLKLLICTLLNNKPEDVEFTLIDLKGMLEMMYFEDIKQTKRCAGELEDAVEALREVKEDIERRQKELRKKKVNNVYKAGIKKRHFVIVDEASQLAPSQVPQPFKKLCQEAQSYMSFITKIGHSMGYTLVYATQYPVGDVMPNQIKANSNTTICFRLETDTQSDTVLDETGAELIQEKGRCIYAVPSGRQKVQTYLIDDDTINKVIAPHIVMKPRKEQTADAEGGHKGEKDGKHTLVIKKTRLS